MGRGTSKASGGSGGGKANATNQSKYDQFVKDYYYDDNAKDFFSPTDSEINALVRRKDIATKDDLNDSYMQAIYDASNGLHTDGSSMNAGEVLVEQLVGGGAIFTPDPFDFAKEISSNADYLTLKARTPKQLFSDAKAAFSKQVQNATDTKTKQYYQDMVTFTNMAESKYNLARKKGGK